MVVVVSVGIHGCGNFVSTSTRRRRAARPGCREFLLLCVRTRSGSVQAFACDAQQSSGSSTAVWQRGRVPVPKQNLESKKLPDLATVTH